MDVENDFNTLDGSLMSELHIPMHTTDSMYSDNLYQFYPSDL
jgi:hypothetical protein